MTAMPGVPFSWRQIPERDARVEHPRLRQPLCLIVDDPAPGYNPGYFHSGFRHGPLRVPSDLIDAFADLIERTGIRGKFSVIPNPFGLGRIDHQVEGLGRAEVDHFLAVVRERIAPRLDITPEVLTHWNAIDLATGRLLPLWEHVWSRLQTRGTLTPYLSLALEIMNAVDLPCSGMTSPWDFGDGVEQEYAEAIAEAQRRVNGRALTWYFLQMDDASPHVPPRLPVFDPEAARAVVSIVSCDAYDFGFRLWHGGEADPDMLIDADGRTGRLAAVLAAGGPAAFHTHWQTMFSQGRLKGLAALEEVARRIEAYFGDRIVWTRCQDLAAYTAGAAGLRLDVAAADEGQRRLISSAPFACRDFTLSLGVARNVGGVSIDGRPLQPAGSLDRIAEGTYALAGDRLYLCWALAGRQQIGISFA